MNANELRAQAGIFASTVPSARDNGLIIWEGTEYYLLPAPTVTGINMAAQRVYHMARASYTPITHCEFSPSSNGFPNELTPIEKKLANTFLSMVAFCGANGINLGRAVMIQHVHNIIEQSGPDRALVICP